MKGMMLAVTGGALDITAPDLARELAKPVAIDRTYPGFGEGAPEFARAVTLAHCWSTLDARPENRVG